jgi:hypothetical protein
LEGNLETLTNNLETCKSLGTKFLEGALTVHTNQVRDLLSFAEFYKSLLLQLQMIAHEYSLQYFVDYPDGNSNVWVRSAEQEAGTSDQDFITASLSSEKLLIDVLVGYRSHNIRRSRLTRVEWCIVWRHRLQPNYHYLS